MLLITGVSQLFSKVSEKKHIPSKSTGLLVIGQKTFFFKFKVNMFSFKSIFFKGSELQLLIGKIILLKTKVGPWWWWWWGGGPEIQGFLFFRLAKI